LRQATELTRVKARIMIGSMLAFARDDTKHEPRSLVDVSALMVGICQDSAALGGSPK
jgi:hypothetical protein